MWDLIIRFMRIVMGELSKWIILSTSHQSIEQHWGSAEGLIIFEDLPL
jgi:hypothetical protein